MSDYYSSHLALVENLIIKKTPRSALTRCLHLVFSMVLLNLSGCYSCETEKYTVAVDMLTEQKEGHFQYYGVSENYNGILRFYKETIKMIKKWLNRRSQKRKMNWEKFTKYLEHYPLLKPKIVHNLYLSPVR